MRQPLLLLGAGGIARETAALVEAVNAALPTWDLLGMLDDDPTLHGTFRSGIPVLGPLDAVAEYPDASVVACVASPAAPWRRAQVVRRLALDPTRYASLVHPTAVLPSAAHIGAGSVLHAQVVLTCDVRVGRHVAVMPGVVLTHDDLVDDFATFGARVALAGGVRIGKGAYLGAGALVRENLSVGAWSLVGMGAVVTSSVPPAEVWAGLPARRMRALQVPPEVEDASPG